MHLNNTLRQIARAAVALPGQPMRGLLQLCQPQSRALARVNPCCVCILIYSHQQWKDDWLLALLSLVYLLIMDIKPADRSCNSSAAIVPGTMINSTSEAVFGVALTCLSCLGFQLLGKTVECSLTPSSAKNNPWKWKNIFVSFIHACLSSFGALYWWVQFILLFLRIIILLV